MNFTCVIPPLAEEILHSDAAGYGFLMAASGLGSLLAALWLVFGGAPASGRIAGGAIILGVARVAPGLTQVVRLVAGADVLVGLGAITMAATANTTIQLAVPDHLRGRVMSVYTTVFAGVRSRSAACPWARSRPSSARDLRSGSAAS